MECPNCGASPPPGSTRCDYCLAPLAVTNPTADETLTRAAIFEAIRRSPQFEQAQSPGRQAELLPSLQRIRFVRMGMLGVASLFAAASAVVFFGALLSGEFCLAVYGLGLLAISILVLRFFRSEFRKFDSAPMRVVAQPALVASQIGFGIVCEFEDGTRKTLTPARLNLRSEVREGDAGVAITRHSILLAFDRVLV